MRRAASMSVASAWICMVFSLPERSSFGSSISNPKALSNAQSLSERLSQQCHQVTPKPRLSLFNYRDDSARDRRQQSLRDERRESAPSLADLPVRDLHDCAQPPLVASYRRGLLARVF